MTIIALLGTLAVNTATVDIQSFGSLKRAASTFVGAEAGIDLSIPIIEQTLAEGDLTPTSFEITNSDGGTDTVAIYNSLGPEIHGSSDYDTDDKDFVVPDFGGVRVETDVDRLYSYQLPGGAMQFASGYEGVGAAAAGGGTGVLYRVRSKGTR